MVSLEMQALRDLKVLVLDSMGSMDSTGSTQSEHGSRRLGAALRQLVGPASMLTPMLKGLDAGELMRLAAPEAGYEVKFEVEQSADEKLRIELSALKLTALKNRARQEGVAEELLEDVDDEDDVKRAVITLILATASSRDDNEHEARQALESELAGLKMKALKKRARDAGVSTADLEDADDAENIRGAVTELIVSAEMNSTPSDDRPHFGSAPTAAPAQPVHGSTKHIMLSYQWDHQKQVARVHETLTRLGVKCWMDISDGMGQDIYDSMAEGVSNAAVVVCFMSQKCKYTRNLHHRLVSRDDVFDIL